MKKIKMNKDSKVATPLLGKNGLKYTTKEKVVILADTRVKQFAISIVPGDEREIKEKI